MVRYVILIARKNLIRIISGARTLAPRAFSSHRPFGRSLRVGVIKFSLSAFNINNFTEFMETLVYLQSDRESLSKA